MDANLSQNNSSLKARSLKRTMEKNFFRKGIIIALMSGIAYGLYVAFINLGMGDGVWADWYAEDNPANLSAFTIVFVLGVLGSGINDTVSAIWALIIAGIKGKLGDFFRCIKTKPGFVMILCAVAGGPIASAAFIIALQTAGTIATPITALCPAIGAILSRILFKQKLSPRMILGILICLTATVMIWTTTLGDEVPEGRAFGIAIAFIAALCWGIEGCIAGYGTTVIDYEIGITIRQLTSGILNLAVLLPIVSVIAGDITIGPKLLGQAVTSGHAMIFFVISGLFALYAYSLWYKGNSMCGTALGMACNGAYSFWTPLFSWVIIGVILGQEGYELAPIAWAAAVIMFLGILIIAVNPLTLFKSKTADEL